MASGVTRLPASPPFDPEATPDAVTLARGGTSLRLTWHDGASAVLSIDSPTNPQQRLRPIADLKETITYRAFSCSPCIHTNGPPPCNGDNRCMKSMAQPEADLAPLWRA